MAIGNKSVIIGYAKLNKVLIYTGKSAPLFYFGMCGPDLVECKHGKQCVNDKYMILRHSPYCSLMYLAYR